MIGSSPPPMPNERLAALEARVMTLEDALAQLNARFADFERQFHSGAVQGRRDGIFRFLGCVFTLKHYSSTNDCYSQKGHDTVKNEVPSVERTIRLMQALAAGGETTSLGLARRLGISQSSCYRILQTLEAAEWIRPDARGEYVFALGLMPFVKPLMGIEQASACLRPAMEELARAAGVTVKLSTREGVEQVTVARIEAQHPFSATSPVGTRFPVVLGASGACLLSALDDAALAQQVAHADRKALWGHESAGILHARVQTCRKTGMCENIGSHPQGIDTLSAPLASASRVFTLTLVGLRGDFAGKRHAQARRLLRAAVAAAKSRLEKLP